MGFLIALLLAGCDCPKPSDFSDPVVPTAAVSVRTESLPEDPLSAWPELDAASDAWEAVVERSVASGASGFTLRLHAEEAPDRLDAILDFLETYDLPVRLDVGPLFPEAELDRALERRAKLRVVVSGLWSRTGGADAVRRVARRHPQVWFDTAPGTPCEAGLLSLSDATAPLQTLVLDMPRRFLFCADAGEDPRRTAAVWAFLSSPAFETSLLPGRTLEGLSLPPFVLRLILRDNFRSLFETRPS